MKLVVVIVSYNVRHYLEQCLMSLRRALDGIDAQICVADNHSKDSTVEALRPLFPDVRFVAGNHNLGFARANNIILRQTESDFVLLLNPDTVVAEDCIRQSLAFMEAHPAAGALGVKMHNTTGRPAKESRRGVPSPLVAFYKMSGLCARYPQSRRFGKYYMGYLPWNEPAQIEVVSGAYCLLRRAAINKVGLLDEDFFMYGEDIDLSYRLLKGGFENWYLPQRILHYKGESTTKSSFRYVHVFYGAMLIFFRKHYAHFSLLVSLPVKAAICVRASLALLGTLKKKMLRSMGFLTRSNRSADVFHFIGGAEMIERCRKAAADNAWTASFCTADEQSQPDGHLAQQYDTNNRTTHFMVYDTSAYSYERIMQLFEQRPQDNLKMAFYHPENHTVITEKDILFV